MAEASEPRLGRREFVQGAVSGAALAAAPGLVLAASQAVADKAAVLANPKVQGLDGAVASFVEFLYALS